MQAILCSAVMALILCAFPDWLSPDADTVVRTLLDLGDLWQTARPSVPAALANAGFILSWLISLAGRWRRRTGQNSSPVKY